MQLDEVNKALHELVEKRNELAQLKYSDPKYDDLEEVIHDMEDDFLDAYGEYFEDILTDVHDRNFPESDVLSPIAYLVKKYTQKTFLPNGTVEYKVPAKEGVWVEAFEIPNKNVRLILLPNPPRLVIHLENGAQKEVWNASQTSIN
jgi:hypothetical protein